MSHIFIRVLSVSIPIESSFTGLDGTVPYVVSRWMIICIYLIVRNVSETLFPIGFTYRLSVELQPLFQRRWRMTGEGGR